MRNPSGVRWLDRLLWLPWVHRDVPFTGETVNRPRFLWKVRAGDDGGRREKRMDAVAPQPGCSADRRRGRQTADARDVGKIFPFFCSVKSVPSFSFAPEIKPFLCHDYYGCRCCGFLTDGTDHVDPRCAHARDHTRFVEQEH